MNRDRILGAAAMLGLGVLLGAAPGMGGMGEQMGGQAGQGMMGPGSQTMMDACQRMNQSMTAPLSGDPDRDFATLMIPHHQAAVEMANAELQYGKDPSLRTMAQGILDAQTKEIAQFQQWLQAHPVQTTPGTQTVPGTPQGGATQ